MAKIRSLKLVKEIRKDRHEFCQKPNTFIFMIEVPDKGNHADKMFQSLVDLGYSFEDERYVFEYDGDKQKE